MGVLSNFVLGLAVNSVFEVGKNMLKPSLKKEINNSFESALKAWSINSSIRDSRRDYLKSSLDQVFFGNDDFDFNTASGEIQDFFSKFNQALCENQVAFNFFKEIKDQKSFDQILVGVQGIQSEMESINAQLGDRSPLLAEWNSLLLEYEKLIKSFKPKTALQLVNSLEKRIANEGLSQNKLIASKIEFLKGLCFEFDSDTIPESYLCFIRAYENNKQNTFYQEKACFAYYRTDDIDSSVLLVDVILERDKFNVVANCTKVLLNKENFKSSIEQVPNVTKHNIAFRRLLYVSLNKESNLLDIIEVFPKIVLDEDEYSLDDVTYENYKLSLYIVELAINKFFRENPITFIREPKDTPEKHSLLNNILEIFVNKLYGSEVKINNGIIFFSRYLKYKISNDASHINQLKEIYNDFDAPKGELFGLLLANILQMEDRDEEAIEILELMDNPTQNVLRLKMFCADKNQNSEFLIAIIAEMTSVSFPFSVLETTDLLRALRIANTLGVLSDLNVHLPPDSQFEKDSYKIIIESFCHVLKGSEMDISDIESLFNKLSEEDIVFKSCILQMFFEINEFDRTVQIFESFSSVDDLIPLDIQLYISSLLKLKTKNKELLYWLKYYRENINYRGDFGRIELQKLATINDWGGVFEIAKEGYENEKNEYFLLYIFISCYHLSEKDKLEVYLEAVSNTQFNEAQVANQITQLLLHFDYIDEAFELGYQWAKEKDNKDARTIFFSTILTGKDLEKIFVNYPNVVEGAHVRYVVNDQKNIQSKIVGGDEFSQQLLGREVGYEFDQKQTFGNAVDKIKIVGIVNKYLALKFEIMEETDNPHSGLGLQSFKIDFDKNPLEQLFSFLPRQEKQKDPFEEYYSEKITYSQLPWMSPELNRNLIFSYYKLVHEYKGLLKVGLQHFLKFPVIKDPSFILDFSSLPHFYELSKSGEFNPNIKFKISSYTKVLLKQYKEDIYSFRSTEKYTIDLKFYENLENWIDEYCDVISPASLLDMTAEKESVKEPMVIYLLNNSAMLEEIGNSILVTDDLTYYKIYSLEMNKIISTDFFVIYHQLLSKYSLMG